jgi:uncharacterized protein involved in response to NO
MASMQGEAAQATGRLRNFEPWRLFFPSALLLAPVNILIWLAARGGLITAPGAGYAGWHGREMLFGYAFAVIAGYLLRAMPLVAVLSLWLLWLAGRLLWLVPPGSLPPALELAVAGVFPAVVALVGARRFAAAKRLRNLAFPVIMVVLGTVAVTNYAMQLGLLPYPAQSPTVLAVYAVSMLITIMGGRLVPTATVGAIRARGSMVRIPVRSWTEYSNVALMLVLVGSEASGHGRLAGVVALLMAMSIAMKIRYWHSLHVMRDPQVWPLHAGFIWIVLGFAAIGLERFGLILVPDMGALHALAAGGIGTITLVMMVRVTRYRGGARQVSDLRLHGLQLVMVLGVVLRVAGGWLLDEQRALMLWLSALAWFLAFAGSAVVLAPAFRRPAQGRGP